MYALTVTKPVPIARTHNKNTNMVRNSCARFKKTKL